LALSISVAMCTFNGGQFLRAQLESVAVQHRPPDELVVCDDGSSDGCEEIVRKFSRRVAFPVHLFMNEENLGTIKNFEKAISLTKGAIVVLADQDDVWYRHKLERIEKAFLSSSGIVAVFSDADLIDEESTLLGVRLWDSFVFDVEEQRRFANGQPLSVLAKHNVVTGATLAFRREFFGVMVPFQDFHDSWMAFLLASCGQFQPISEPLMQYRRHPTQQTGPGVLTLRERIEQIRNNDATFYLGEIERFQKLHERLAKHRVNFRHADLAQTEITRKIAHLERRLGLPGLTVTRIPKVLREAFTGDYQRYSGGWKSVAKDLVQRPQR
jgi:glycosyltransferase involved in cell wall biosynthesis